MSACGLARAAVGALLALACAGAVTAAAPKNKKDDDAPEPKEGVRVERLAGVTGYYAEGAGHVLSVATPRTQTGALAVLILVTPKPPKPPKNDEEEKEASDEKDEANQNCADPTDKAERKDDAPRRLLRFDATGAGALQALREDLPADARELAAADVNGDGNEDLVVVGRAVISVLVAGANGSWSGPLERVAALPRAASGAWQVGVARDAAGAVSVWTADLGTIRTFTRQPAGGWAEGKALPVPVRAKKQGSTLYLTGTEVVPVSAADGPALLVTKPDAAGGDRLISYLLRPGAAEGESRGECWSHLPAPERILESRYLDLDGAPALFVTTRPAEKLSLFGEKLVRLFPLGADRTRMGKAALAAFESGANLWQELHPALRDVNADGRDDLVLGYWKGLKDNTVMLDAYVRRSDGTFEPKPRTTTFDIETADRGIFEYGADIDRADRPDLLLASQADVFFFRGTAPASDARKLVDPSPAWKAPLPGGSFKTGSVSISIGTDGMTMDSLDEADWTFRVLDLDADGASEILCVPPAGSVSEAIAVYRPGGR